MRKLWSASKSEIVNSNLANYESYISQKYNKKFKRNYKNLNFSIIMGEDNLVGLENWKNYNKILESKICFRGW